MNADVKQMAEEVLSRVDPSDLNPTSIGYDIGTLFPEESELVKEALFREVLRRTNSASNPAMNGAFNPMRLVT